MSWHGNSRYWRFGLPVVLATHLLALVAIVWRPDAAGEGFVAVGLVAATFLGGAGATNVVERTHKKEKLP